MAKPLADLPFPALERLLGSLSAARFFDEWWERAPGVLTARSAADREAFRRQDWRPLAQAAGALSDSTVEVIEAGKPQKSPRAALVDDAFGAGASVRILRVQRVWPELEQLCRDLQGELGFRVSANAYVTPEGRQGLDAHTDSHDVIVVQMAGKKDWQIFGAPYRLPVEYRAALVFEEGTRRDHRGDEFGGRGYKDRDVGPPILTCSLAPGDLLYVPRGFVHQAVASHGTSVHVTIGIHATTWGDLLALAVAQEARTEPALRETLPPGATRVAVPRDVIEAELRSRGSRLLERVHGEALMLETAARFAASSAPPNSAATVTADDDRPAAFDATAAYRLAEDAYVTFRPQAIAVRSLRAAAVRTFPAGLKPLFDRLVRGEALSSATAAPLTVRSGEVFLSHLAKAGIVVAVPRPRARRAARAKAALRPDPVAAHKRPLA